jgi:hypothetical protein
MDRRCCVKNCGLVVFHEYHVCLVHFLEFCKEQKILDALNAHPEIYLHEPPFARG